MHEDFLVSLITTLIVGVTGALFVFFTRENPKEYDRRVREEGEAKRRQLVGWIDEQLGPQEKVAWKFTHDQVIAIEIDTARLLIYDGSDHVVLNPDDVADLSIQYRRQSRTKGEGVFTRGIAGGVVAGSAGAIVGALSAERSTEEESIPVGITMGTYDLKKPVWTINATHIPSREFSYTIVTELLPADEITSLERVIPYLRAWLGAGRSTG